MDFSTAYQNPTRFLNLTSLHPEEFDILLPLFREEWYKFYRFRTLEGKRRKSAFSKYRKQTRTLPTVEDKLFFLLTYLKNNPLQHFQGAAFGLSQAKTSIWFNALLPLLRTVLGRLECLPCRDGHALKQALEEFDVQVLTQDVVEQHTGRKTAADAQEVEYSGKKKAHTNKNKVDCLDNQYVVFLSNSYAGHVHDKQIADEECCNYPNGVILRQDKGFEGYRPEGVTIVEPFKKPKGGELTYC